MFTQSGMYGQHSCVPCISDHLCRFIACFETSNDFLNNKDHRVMQNTVFIPLFPVVSTLLLENENVASHNGFLTACGAAICEVTVAFIHSTDQLCSKCISGFKCTVVDHK